jgi:hypothetical protein
MRGRPFTDADVAGSAPVVIVTESLARLLWPGEEAVGRCLMHLRDEEQPLPCREVVGVAEDTRHGGILSEPTFIYFLPLAQQPAFGGTLLVRTRAGDPDAVAPVRAALQTLEPGMPRVTVQRLQDRLDPQLQPWRLGAAMFSGLGALALLLAALGLYGVITYDVAQRRRELGVRVALGARAWNLMRIVLRDALLVVSAGLVIGLAAAGFAAPFIESLLFDVSPRDPLVMGSVAVLLLAIALAAAALPAWRAAQVLPTEALREE